MHKTLLAIFASLCAVGLVPQRAAGEHYGVSFDPASTNGVTSSRIFPVSAGIYRMVQPDGMVRQFHEDASRPGVILGTPPWLGVVDGNSISVCADPDHTGGRRRTAFNFSGGKLQSLYLDGTTYSFRGFKPQEEDPARLWPEERKRDFGKGGADDIWRHENRLRLWFVSPHVAAALLAQLALLGLACLVSLRGWRRLIGALLLPAMLAGLFMTCSRSAFLGFLFGAFAYCFLKQGFVRSLLTPRRLVFFLLAVLAVAGILVATGHAARFTGNLFKVDPGNVIRIESARGCLMAIADAPFGWHGGFLPVRTAILSWYEPSLKRTLWTHLTFIAQLGWVGGFAYLSACAFLLAVAFRLAWKGRTPLAFSVLAAYFIIGWLNPVYGRAELCVVPVLAIAWAFYANPRPTRRAFARLGVFACAVAGLTMAAFIVAGGELRPHWMPSLIVRGKRVSVNGKDPRVWVVEDRHVLGGRGYPGREILLHYLKHPKAEPLGYVHAVRDLPDQVDVLVLPGKAGARYLERFRDGTACKAKKILFLSPAFDPCDIPDALNDTAEVMAVCGDLAFTPKPAWEPLRTTVQILPGIEQYIPDWPEMLAPRLHPKTNTRKEDRK